MIFSASNAMDIILLVSILVIAGGNNVLAARDYDYRQCEVTVRSWAGESLMELEGRTEQERLELKELLFFLHVPRTGGRTYFNCLLRNMVPRDQECPRSYDKLRFDPSKPGCRLVVTHDDYSLMSMLPRDITSVVTVLRDPVERVFSSYEFSIEVAARFLIHRNLSSSMRLRPGGPKFQAVSTLDIWPWRYLVPWMREDLFARRDARRRVRMMIQDNDVNSYDIPAMVMPLHEYIHQPLAHDIIHNGATFQVAGITNNSHLEEAREIRQCVTKYPLLGNHVLEVAKKRLDQMLHVGLTENHKESAAMFVNMIGAEVLSQLQHANDSKDLSYAAAINMTDFNTSSLDTKAEEETTQPQITTSAEENHENFTVAKLLDSYESCVNTSRSLQTNRRFASLKGIAPANFTKQARAQVSPIIIKEIEKLNSLDVELYKHAQKIYFLQRKVLGQEKTSHLQESTSQVDKFDTQVSRHPRLSDLWPVVVCSAIIWIVAKLIGARNKVSKVKL